MITLKTSVLLACSLQLGAILANASEDDQHHLYEFGKNLGIAFQIQDDYLDAFGDPAKFGKQVGGDIQSNKKTFLMIHALETADADLKKELLQLIADNPGDKVERVLNIFKSCKIDTWSNQLKEDYLDRSLQHLEKINIPSQQKTSLIELAYYLINRDK
jgi:geranylgeranyl diphosphate synthase type II